eukprot:CAMPEP_0173435910 /NCGR_PEP_ID=MMETSP1357-20121228/15659_1 /TAXON_ID=77926 /ORGANISM="Hemiselmis rufescens, Strain PCC563" /LENGTH=58 /DNA_ID=CAMNT_0014400949 /DNA_START=286 /DNA_END=462 /DNA_ORIENTATION=+
MWLGLSVPAQAAAWTEAQKALLILCLWAWWWRWWGEMYIALAELLDELMLLGKMSPTG